MIADLVRKLLDRGYEQAAQSMIKAIASEFNSGVMANRLNQLDAEARRLAMTGEKFTADNPVLRATLADLQTALNQSARHINQAATELQRNGIGAASTLTRELALGISDKALASIGIQWNTPDPESLLAAIDFTRTGAWQAELNKFQQGIGDTARSIALRGIAEGRGPALLAEDLVQTITTLPIAKANNLARTLQLASYRAGTAANQVANAAILEGVIRIAVLDSRTCMSCVALHGTLLKVGEIVRDHHQGRCTCVGIVKNRPRSIQSGEMWFARQPEDMQRQMMGDTAYEEWRRGKFQLADYPQPYTDDVFGLMIREKSLKDLLRGRLQEVNGGF